MSEETPDDLDWPFPVQPSLMSDDELDLLAVGEDGPTPTPTVQPDEGEEPLAPINWNLLSPEDARVAWLDLNAWVTWLRHAYGLPPTLIPPLWHRHDELVWELSALHTHWLACYDPGASPSAPIAWHRDLADARNRLREWVATSGSRLDRDRPTRTTTWPGKKRPRHRQSGSSPTAMRTSPPSSPTTSSTVDAPASVLGNLPPIVSKMVTVQAPGWSDLFKPWRGLPTCFR
ncbi:hypothetical protein [Georgenia yuyongxinii]